MSRAQDAGTATVDIFIPHWGDTAYLRGAVDSVLAQRDERWRLTIIDDATPGDAGTETRAYFAELAELGDPRISTSVKAENQGITANFRSCAAAATETLVTIMGNDDLLRPGYVGAVLTAHEQFPDADLIQPSVAAIDERGEHVSSLVDAIKQRVLRPRSSEPVLLSGDQLGAGLMHGDWLYWPSLCFTRETLQRFDFRDEFAVIQDLALLMDMFFAGATLLVLPNTAPAAADFAYRRHGDSASAVALIDGSRFAGERDFYSLAGRLADARGWSRTRRAARLHVTSRAHALTLVPGALIRGRAAAAARMARHAFGS